MGISRRGFLGLIFGSALFKVIDRFLPLPEVSVPSVNIPTVWVGDIDPGIEGEITPSGGGIVWLSPDPCHPGEFISEIQYIPDDEGWDAFGRRHSDLNSDILPWIVFRDTDE